MGMRAGVNEIYGLSLSLVLLSTASALQRSRGAKLDAASRGLVRGAAAWQSSTDRPHRGKATPLITCGLTLDRLSSFAAKAAKTKACNKARSMDKTTTNAGKTKESEKSKPALSLDLVKALLLDMQAEVSSFSSTLRRC